ncbi:MAG: hypothetical protein M9921_01035 [Fimbriimonadaceae bacterium]|nr:hypothetical protein [Fimbriimonadaceae bacterium]
MEQVQQPWLESHPVGAEACAAASRERTLSVWWVPIVLVLCVWMAVQNNALAEQVDREVAAQTFASR